MVYPDPEPDRNGPFRLGHIRGRPHHPRWMTDAVASRSTGRWELGVHGAWIHRAGEDDLDLAAEILEDAAAWVASLGMPAWEAGSFREPEGRGRARLVDALRTGDLHVARIRDRAVATVSLFQEDERFWPGWPPDALYVHKLAVRRRDAGLGLGGAILRWAAAQTAARGRRYVRLDCPRDDPGIRAYYERAGFVHRGDVTVGSFEAALYERPV